MAAHAATFRKAVKIGVKIAFGTDAAVGPHGANAEELALMVDHGMTPAAALRAATVRRRRRCSASRSGRHPRGRARRPTSSPSPAIPSPTSSAMGKVVWS